MAPSVHTRPALKAWFTKLWEMEKADDRFMQFKEGSRPVPGKDGDSKVIRENLGLRQAGDEEGVEVVQQGTLETEEFHDGQDAGVVLEGEVRDAISCMLSAHKEQVTTTPSLARINPTIDFAGHTIYKSTLVSQLNGNPFLSKDRVTRVKHSMYFDNHENYATAAACSSTCLLGIGSNCGVYFV